jgi:hypothetical protein
MQKSGYTDMMASIILIENPTPTSKRCYNGNKSAY